jgi:hypothetical protein
LSYEVFLAEDLGKAEEAKAEAEEAVLAYC